MCTAVQGSKELPVTMRMTPTDAINPPVCQALSYALYRYKSPKESHNLRRGSIITPILQSRKLRYKEIRQLTQCHTSSKWQIQDLNPGSLVPQFLFLTPMLYYLLNTPHAQRLRISLNRGWEI